MAPWPAPEFPSGTRLVSKATLQVSPTASGSRKWPCHGLTASPLDWRAHPNQFPQSGGTFIVGEAIPAELPLSHESSAWCHPSFRGPHPRWKVPHLSGMLPSPAFAGRLPVGPAQDSPARTSKQHETRTGPLSALFPLKHQEFGVLCPASCV